MKPTLVFDIEVYINYFLLMFRNVATGNIRYFEMFPESSPLDTYAIRRILASCRLVSFNGNHYDLPLIAIALSGGSCATIKRASDQIILNNMREWQIADLYDARVPPVDHIDLIEVAPGTASLKSYGARLHAPKLQDLPIDPAESITPEQRIHLREYCANDLGLTQTLWEAMQPQIQLREAMSAEYGIDLRSKSDAQIAEAVIKDQLHKTTGVKPGKVTLDGGTTFRYRVPEWIVFHSQVMRDTLNEITSSDFYISDGGKVMMPRSLEKKTIELGAGHYRMGIGGLHSSETAVAIRDTRYWAILDRDVSSYYPSIILGQGLFPKHLGRGFLEVYRGIVERRLKAKIAGDKVVSEALKITINGSFGKFGSKWSTLYSPDLLIQTTVTGQLALLMLIETVSNIDGIEVVSANTDGVVMRVRRYREPSMAEAVAAWERCTGFQTEETRYSAYFARDVNNYIAFKYDGTVKTKGAYALPGNPYDQLKKNPTCTVCVDAVVNALTFGVPLMDTLLSCRDVRRFVTTRSVAGGAVHNGSYLGKCVRWYYSKRSRGPITYRINGNRVAGSEGCAPLMVLPDSLPVDIDYGWYEAESSSILKDMGVTL